jgi:multidrug efflux pump subunit AcrA (membrane-fusion protein)
MGIGDGTGFFTGTFASEAPNVDPQSQGRGFLYLVKENTEGRLRPGAALTGWLRNGDEPQAGIVIPRSAVVRAEGKAWVYVVSGAERFVRREVAVDQPTESGWFVTSDFAAGEKVVTVGAAQLLSEELKSRIQGGD